MTASVLRRIMTNSLESVNAWGFATCLWSALMLLTAAAALISSKWKKRCSLPESFRFEIISVLGFWGKKPQNTRNDSVTNKLQECYEVKEQVKGPLFVPAT